MLRDIIFAVLSAYGAIKFSYTGYFWVTFVVFILLVVKVVLDVIHAMKLATHGGTYGDHAGRY